MGAGSSAGCSNFVTLVTWFDEVAPGSLNGVVLETGDLDATMSELTARGVVFEEGVHEEPWGRFAMFADPDRNRFILQTTSVTRGLFRPS